MMDERPANAVEEMLKDAAESQRSRGLIPELNKTREYLTDIVQRVERKTEDRRRRFTPAADIAQRRTVRDWTDDELNSEFRKRVSRQKRDLLPGHFSISRDVGGRKERVRRARTDIENRIAARVRLIRDDPEWALRAKRINPLALSGELGVEKQRHAEQLWRDLIRESTSRWGPWWRPAEKRLFFDSPK